MKNEKNITTVSNFDIKELKLPGITEDQLQLLEKKLLSVTYQERDVIFRQNTLTSHVMFIRSGYVKVYKEGRNSKVIILKIATKGQYIGLLSLFGSDLHEYSASAIKKTDCVFVDKNILRQILLENGKIADYFLSIISKKGLYIFDRLLSQSHKQLPGRIADVLLYFSEVIYKSESFEFPLTRKELAELAGTTKESFIRTLTEFKNDKIIELNGKKVEIRSKKIVKILSQLG